MAKTRNVASAKKKTSPAKKSMAKKSTGGKKKGTSTRAKATKELDLRPLKKQIKAHVEMLSRATSGDKRVADAITSLRRVHMELDRHCDPTMTIPLA